MGLFDVDGKIAVVTGGTRGVGLMAARGLVEGGATVLISSRKADACAAAAEELGCDAVAADLSTSAGVATLADAVRARYDRVDVLMNNAGATWGAPIDAFPLSGFDKVFDLNVRAIFELTQQLLPLLRAGASAQDPARVINVGSVDGIRPPVTESYSYSSAKAAVHMLTRHLAKRLAGEQITVNAIAPGPFESKMTAFMLDSEEGRAAVASHVPLGRIGEPEDIAGTVLFLSSRASAYLTGVVIPVDGGITGAA